MIYLGGSLKKHDEVQAIAAEIRTHGFDVFDQWTTAGPDADDYLRDYFARRGMNFKQALQSPAAQNIFEFDKKHILQSEAFVLVMPAGKSAFLELGWALGQGIPGYILFPEGDPERIDIMFAFANAVVYSVKELVGELRRKTT